MSTEPESFLARWSRRKREAERKAGPPAEPVAPAAAAPPVNTDEGDLNSSRPASAAVPASGPALTTEAPPLPPIDSLDGVRSDYQAFFQPRVSEDLRRAALNKLFADPHFNQMDMLDVYVDDYTQFEPLPAAMRLKLPSARDFLLDSERAALEAAEAEPSPAPEALADTSGARADSPVVSAAAADAASADELLEGNAAKVADVVSSPAAPRVEAPPDSTSN